MRLPLLRVAIPLLFAGCSSVNREAPERAAPSYEMRTYRLESAAGCSSDTACAVFQVEYPVFAGLDEQVSASLQREIEAAFSLGDPAADSLSLGQIAAGFIADYEEFSSSFPESGLGWHFTGKAAVTVLSDTLVSVMVDEEYFTGGAHGGGERHFVNRDPRTGKPVRLEDIYRTGVESVLNAYGEKEFRRVRGLADTTSFRDVFFEFPDDRFALNENYGFTGTGILFHFNAYEIAPYAAGPTEILVPYTVLSGWAEREDASSQRVP